MFRFLGVGYQNKVKRVRGVHIRRNFWYIFKNEDSGFDIIKSQICRPFSCRVSSKLYFSFINLNGSVCAKYSMLPTNLQENQRGR